MSNQNFWSVDVPHCSCCFPGWEKTGRRHMEEDEGGRLYGSLHEHRITHRYVSGSFFLCFLFFLTCSFATSMSLSVNLPLSSQSLEWWGGSCQATDPRFPASYNNTGHLSIQGTGLAAQTTSPLTERAAATQSITCCLLTRQKVSGNGLNMDLAAMAVCLLLPLSEVALVYVSTIFCKPSQPQAWNFTWIICVTLEQKERDINKWNKWLDICLFNPDYFDFLKWKSKLKCFSSMQRTTPILKNKPS